MNNGNFEKPSYLLPAGLSAEHATSTKESVRIFEGGIMSRISIKGNKQLRTAKLPAVRCQLSATACGADCHGKIRGRPLRLAAGRW